MPKGYLDTTSLDFPANIDEAYLRGLENNAGVQWSRCLQLIDQRLVAASQVVDPLVAAIAFFTTNPVAAHTSPQLFELEEESEYAVPRPELGEPPRSALLPLRRWVKSMGFTEAALEEITEAEVLRQVDMFLWTFQRGLTLRVLRRFTSIAEVYVDRGTTATSPGFAGSGTGDNLFTGNYPTGTALPGDYTHYFRDTAANLDVMLDAMRARLGMWNPGPFELVGSEASIGAVMLSEKFTPATSDLILRAQGVAAANVDANTYVGVYGNDVRVWIGRPEFGSSLYYAMFKTFGTLNARNPVAIRYDPNFGRGIDIRMREMYPLDQAIMRQRYGVGIANRTGAALGLTAGSGPYVDPVLA